VSGASLTVDIVVDRRSGFRLECQFALEAGGVLAVMGPSGAGKSTLAHAIAGLARVSAGRIQVGDRLVVDAEQGVHRRPAERGVVLLEQQPRLFPHLSVRDNVAFGLRARGVSSRRARLVADEWLQRVGLEGAGPHRPMTLSGGQQQRVAVARALAVAPSLLIFDEPLTALDPRTEAEVRVVIRDQVSATSMTTIVVTHSALDAAALASTLMFVENGVVVQQGPVTEVLRAPTTDFAAVAVGLNRIVGAAESGVWRAATGELQLSSPTGMRAGAAAVFRPADVRLRLSAPSGETPAWAARIDRLERHPAGVRIHTVEPAVSVDVAAELVAAYGLRPGHPVWLQVDERDVLVIAIAP
jgi:molybdate transport system ATP-binding protein